MNYIYLDHNATTPLALEVADAMQACEQADWGNPASQHAVGRRARRRLEDAREGIATLLGANVQSARLDNLIFTSGGTESNNLALFGLCGSQATLGRLVISAIEHPSITGPAEELARRGWQVERAPVTPGGIVDLDWLSQQLRASERSRPTVVSVMLGNNETGVLQPVRELAAICRSAGALLHTDAVQAAGKIPVSFQELDLAAVSLSAHKFHGPRGIGGLLLRHDVNPRPLLYGGFQQSGFRPGTEPVALAVGIHEALRLAALELPARAAKMAALRDELEATIQAGYPGAVVHGQAAPRLPHTSNISFPGLERQSLQMALDLAGVVCSTGSACASGSTDPSPVLIAMGCSSEHLHSSLRFSLGAGTTSQEIAEACRRILSVCNDLRSGKQPRNLAAKGRISG